MTDDMNDDARLEAGIGTALQEYADDVHPDLDTLVRASRVAGDRIRLRRRLGGSLAVAATVAGIIGAASLGGMIGNHPESATGPGFASQPTVPAHPKTCPNGLDKDLRARTPQFKPARNAGGPKAGLGNLSEAIRHQRSGPAVCTLKPLTKLKPMTGDSAPPAIYHGQDVTIHLAGWKQVGAIGDDKQSLEGPGGAVADIVWRSASDHHEWVTSPDKGNALGVWVSDVHHGVFVSIQGGSGTTDADVQALGASLTWN